MDLGTRILNWLRAKGLTQKWLASAVGVSIGAVSAWVNNGSPPTQKNLDAIVEALGLTHERFYGRIPKAKKPARTAAKRAHA
jgi:transcriptional regulator with XRE-family HTH domain